MTNVTPERHQEEVNEVVKLTVDNMTRPQLCQYLMKQTDLEMFDLTVFTVATLRCMVTDLMVEAFDNKELDEATENMRRFVKQQKESDK